MKEVIPGINYEVALEVLGNAAQPFIQAREEERKKSHPMKHSFNIVRIVLKRLQYSAIT